MSLALVLLAAYPIALPHPTAAEVARREAEFRTRNPQVWQQLVLDEHGFVAEASSADPKLAVAGLPQLQDFVRANADLFGIEAGDAGKLAAVKGVGFELVESSEIGVLEQIVIYEGTGKAGPTITFHAMFAVRPPAATVTVPQVVLRVAGKRYREAVTYGATRPLDCDMVPGGCQLAVFGTVTRDVTLAPGDAKVFTTLHREADQVRLVRCVDLEGRDFAPPDPKWHHAAVHGRTFAPLSTDAPAIPLVIDAVTGEVLALHPDRCWSLRNLR